MIWRAMTFFALLISLAALLIAVMAYQRAGGDLKLQQMMQSTRQETANALDRIEKFVRGYRKNQEGVEGLRER